MPDAAQLTADEWLALGVAAGYCTPPVCWTHDVPELTETEQHQLDTGWDPCVPVVRLR